MTIRAKWSLCVEGDESKYQDFPSFSLGLMFRGKPSLAPNKFFHKK